MQSAKEASRKIYFQFRSSIQQVKFLFKTIIKYKELNGVLLTPTTGIYLKLQLV
jgi:hypothetical protein